MFQTSLPTSRTRLHLNIPFSTWKQTSRYKSVNTFKRFYFHHNMEPKQKMRLKAVRKWICHLGASNFFSLKDDHRHGCYQPADCFLLHCLKEAASRLNKKAAHDCIYIRHWLLGSSILLLVYTGTKWMCSKDWAVAFHVDTACQCGVHTAKTKKELKFKHMPSKLWLYIWRQWTTIYINVKEVEQVSSISIPDITN